MKRMINSRMFPAAMLGLLVGSGAVSAAPLNISPNPLFLGVSVDPNVFFMTDDSGSMDWEIVTDKYWYYNTYWGDNGATSYDNGAWHGYSNSAPDQCDGARYQYGYIFENSDNLYTSCGSYGPEVEKNAEAVLRDWRIRSSDFNYLYYDPSVTYQPWPGKTDASFSAAHSNPQSGSSGYNSTRNLDGFVYEVWIDNKGYSGTHPSGPDTATSTANGEVDVWDSHTRITVNGSTINVEAFSYTPDPAQTCTNASLAESPPMQTCFGTVVNSFTATTDGFGRTVDEMKQNIANWYEYYRRRSFVAKNAIASVITALPDNRYGMSLINDYNTLFVGVPGASVTDYTAHNDDLVNRFYSYAWRSQGTPLRRGLEVVGRYFTSAGASNNFGKTDPIVHTCQQNFAVLFTDGYYNGSAPYDVDFSIADSDGDGYYDTVADIAHAYYVHDLSDLADLVPSTSADPATYQHLVTFTVAFGVEGNLVDTDSDGWPNEYANGTAMPSPLATSSNWGNPFASTDNPERIDDLWHAAFNSKGEFVSASRPSEVVDALESALKVITDRTASSASVALNSGSLNSGAHVFQARFSSLDWSGQLLAYEIYATGTLAGTLHSTPTWDAADEMDAQSYSSRVVLTSKQSTGDGIVFDFPSNYLSPGSNELDAAQAADLLTYATATWTDAQKQAFGEAVVKFLKGDSTNEGAGYDFRVRGSVLGDIISSNPVYVGAPGGYGYSDTWVDELNASATHPENSGSAEDYSVFKTRLASRTPMIYVGANDGMLHGIQATTSGTTGDGQERLAYVPRVLFPKLAELASKNYVHQYYVDGGPAVTDAFVSGEWRSMLVGGLGGGGQSIFALDVTDPSIFAPANAADIVAWEFTDADDADLGYTYSRPSIVRLHNGKWAAIFGNGYNNTEADGNASATGNAALYIVDLSDGSLIKKINTNTGMSQDPTGSSRPNGLATVTPVDLDGDNIVDRVYGGDLFGNVWKFDLSDSSSVGWGIDGPGTSLGPIFVATDGKTITSYQPITVAPSVGDGPAGLSGVMVLFGTGQYLEIGDNLSTGQPNQTFYGLWDNDWTSVITRSELQEQEIIEELKDSYGNEVRATTDNSVDYSTKRGWYMDLLNQGATVLNNAGEKVVSDSVLRSGRIIFTTLLPSDDPCEYGGSSWLMELDAYSGSRLPNSPFDLNGDGLFTVDDYVNTTSGTFAGSGKKSTVGITPTPNILGAGGTSTNEYKYGSGSSGGTEVTLGNTQESVGRQSWRMFLR